jgi:hypothetical protein
MKYVILPLFMQEQNIAEKSNTNVARAVRIGEKKMTDSRCIL